MDDQQSAGGETRLCRHEHHHHDLSRRALITRGGVALAAGTIAASALGPATADASNALASNALTANFAADRHRLPRPAPLPKRIPGGVPADPNDPGAGTIPFWLPGPTDATTPIIGLEGMGLDVEPSGISDFSGDSAFAVVSGEAETTDGPQLVEFDVRVMEGNYVAENGVEAKAAFAFF